MPRGFFNLKKSLMLGWNHFKCQLAEQDVKCHRIDASVREVPCFAVSDSIWMNFPDSSRFAPLPGLRLSASAGKKP
jgi:hypothetical protein